MNTLSASTKPVLHVEVMLLPTCTIPAKVMLLQTRDYLDTLGPNLDRNTGYNDIILRDFKDSELGKSVESISICDVDLEKGIAINEADIRIHVYQLSYDEPGMEMFTCENGDSELAAAQQWILPSTDFHEIWETLVYESDIKSKLLNYVSSTLLFSDKQVNSAVITCNRVVLLHGPPGTGKTSLCRALAQKLSIRFSHRYKYGQLIEINSHSLFSKWFSESGKLVMKLFQTLRSVIEDSDALVILLIDEVESLTHARTSAMAGSEPSDSIRVVNALLTQIDQIRRYPNVLILTTSNITGAIDLAFIDRADVKQYIGLPCVAAIYNIYFSCITELMRAGILCHAESLLSLRQLHFILELENNSTTMLSRKLYEIAEKSVGLSGRMLRKLPLMAHALFLQSETADLETFLEALLKAVLKEFQDKRELGDATMNKM